MEVAAMATQLNASGGGYGSKKIEIRWISRRERECKVFSNLKSTRIPIFISSNPSHINPQDLKELYRKCNHSCYRFPPVDQNGKVVEAVDLKKLRVALSHSSMLVSVFCNLRDVVTIDKEREAKEVNRPLMGLGDLLRTMMPLPPVSPSDAQLVGFGRTVSDFGLTAAIYDVMVIPSLQRMGIGTMIVKRMIRMLTSRDIYDISALCSVNERLFFKACGFGDDVLGSTTMMYTRTASTYSEGEQMVKSAVCLIAARGLRRTSSFWKLQWFAVGWIDPNSRYCTKIDASANANPTWNTKFATLVEDSNFQDMALHVEVYSREPLFLRERLQGTATIVLKEFLAKYSNSSETSRPAKEVGSYQLRKRNSSKPQGFIDVSIRISEDRGDQSSFAGNEGEFVLMGHSNNIALSSEGGFQQAYPSELPLAPPRRPANFDHAHPMPYQTDHSNPSKAGPSYHPPPAAGPSYHPPRTPPPPPPPSHVGYVPTFLPNTDYINMPSSAAAPGRGVRPGLVGVGAGALAAGAVIFGDDFMSGFNVPASLPDPSLTISIDPPF